MKRSLNSWIGSQVRAKDGDVGTVDRFCFDDLTWLVRYVGVNTSGWLTERSVLISLSALGKPDWDKRLLPVDLTMEQVRGSPKTDIDEPVSREYELALHDHYAWPVYWVGGFYFPLGYGMASVPLGEAKTVDDAPGGVRKAEPHLHSTLELAACRVHASDGNIGHVEDALVDDAWAIRHLVVDVRNWLPDRRVLVSPKLVTAVNWTDKKVSVDLTREAVKNCPAFDASSLLILQDEAKVAGHVQRRDVAEWVAFHYHAPAGLDVYVAGTFNNWDPWTIKMGYNGKGTYIASVLLMPGRYEYKFVVNGEWCNGADGNEKVANEFGTTNSVLHVHRALDHTTHHHTFARKTGSGDHPLWNALMWR